MPQVGRYVSNVNTTVYQIIKHCVLLRKQASFINVQGLMDYVIEKIENSFQRRDLDHMANMVRP